MLLKKVVLRGVIPFIIMSAISIIMKSQGMESSQVRSTFIVGMIIASVAAASVLYEIRSWSLLKQSVVHFILMFLTVFPCLLISGWFELHSVLDYAKVLGIFLSAGIVLWIILYVIFGKLLSK
mgnify:CR=1 FL=1